MPSNAAFRRALDEATTIRYPEIYRETIEQLRSQFEHSIEILSDGKGPTTRFNCFAYGLGVWEHPEYVKRVDEASNTAIINSGLVQAMIDGAALREVAASEVPPGDVAVYFLATKVTHAAVVGLNRVLGPPGSGRQI